MKLLIDMNLAPAWAPFLKQAGFETAHWSEIGAPNADDAVILEYARTHDLVLLTNDLDFSAILAASAGTTPSIVQVRAANLGLDSVGGPIVSALRKCASELSSGAILTVDERRARLRKLPIKS